MGRAIIYLVLLTIVMIAVVLAVVMPFLAAKSARRQREEWEKQEVLRLEAERIRHDELSS